MSLLRTQSKSINVGGKDIDFEVFKTFIVRFIGNQEYSFYNVETPEDARNQEIHDLDDFEYRDGLMAGVSEHVTDSNYNGGTDGDFSKQTASASSFGVAK